MSEPCVHHWVLEEPNGPTSTGTCRKCGTVRVYQNWIHDLDFKLGAGESTGWVTTGYGASGNRRAG